VLHRSSPSFAVGSSGQRGQGWSIIVKRTSGWKIGVSSLRSNASQSSPVNQECTLRSLIPSPGGARQPSRLAVSLSNSYREYKRIISKGSGNIVASTDPFQTEQALPTAFLIGVLREFQLISGNGVGEIRVCLATERSPTE
jgi:hypothetical protein